MGKWFFSGLICFFWIGWINAQNIPLHPEAIFPREYSLVSQKGHHTGILPYRSKENDSVYQHHLFHAGGPKYSLSLAPIITGLYQNSKTNSSLHIAGGFHTFGNLTRKLTYEARYSLHYLSLDSTFFSPYLSEGRVVPHYRRYSSNKGNKYFIHDLTFHLNFQPIKYIQLEAGIGKHHIGDGYRSLFLSSNAAPYPYLKTSFQFWRVHYFSMVTSMRDYLVKKGFEGSYKKYVSMHYLSWNITDFLNLNLFEAVIWERADTLSKRSLDIHYLNPVIFYRPLEYNLGSPDNVVMGIGTRINILKNFRVYGQFLLDEFNLKEIKARKQWWANKYAYQLGARLYNPFNLKNLTLQAEYNQARPYTYTHNYQLQNYGNWLQPLAHPLGSNFRELILICRYRTGNWALHARSVNSWQGVGVSGENVGTDIYQSSASRNKDYDNYILQGTKSNFFRQEVKLARTLVPSWNLQAEVTGSYRIYQDISTRNTFFITVGFRTLIFEEDNLL